MLDMRPVNTDTFSDFKNFMHHITSASIKTFLCSPCTYQNRSLLMMNRIYFISYDERLLFRGNTELVK